MSLVTNSFVSTPSSDVKLTVKTGTSGEADFKIEHIDRDSLYTAADAAADAAIAEYVVQAFTLTGATLTSTPTDLTDGTYTGVATTGGTGSGATFTVVVSSSTYTAVTMVAAGSGYTTGDVLTIAHGVIGNSTGSTDATITVAGADANVGVIAAATLTAAADAATAAGMTTLAAAITGAADDTAAKAVLDAAVVATTGDIAAAQAAALAATGNFTVADLTTGNYRIAYSDAIGAVNYNANNSVQVIQFSIVNGVMVGTHGKLSNVKTNQVLNASGVITTAATEITGTLTGLINGKGYGMQFTHVDTISSSASVGTGSQVERVIVNNGPIKLADHFRVNLTPVTGAGNENKATIQFKLASVTDDAGVTTDSKANHSTGKYTDLKYLRFMWADAITCVFKTVDIDLRAITIYTGGNTLLTSREVDFQSPVATTLFEYSAALVDTAGAVSEYASTQFASSVADNATHVRDIEISGNSSAGTEINVQWIAPSFTAKTIVGYEIITQELVTGKADLASATLASGTPLVTPFICDMNRSSNGSKKIVIADLAYKVTSAVGVTPVTYSPTILDATITGLSARSKYAVWVRAYHADVDSVKVYGSIGIDTMAAPALVWSSDDGSSNAGTVAFDASLHSWAGSYIETAAGATGIADVNATSLFAQSNGTLTGVFSTLTGAPADFATGSSISMVSGINVQANILPAAAYDSNNDGTNDVAAVVAATMPAVSQAGDDLMEKSIAIKWDDKDVSFEGMETDKKMEYICFTKADYDALEGLNSGTVADFYNGTLQKTAATSSAAATYYSPGWTTAVDSDSNVGEGMVTPSTYSSISTNSSVRYCRFAAGVSAADGALATFHTSTGALKTNGTEAKVVPEITGITLTADKTGLDPDATGKGILKASGGFTLGTEYRFVLRLSNANGENTPKLMDATMVTGRASAATFLKEDAQTASELIEGTSLMWDNANNKFVFNITDTHANNSAETTDDVLLHEPTGAKPTDMSYEVVVTGSQGDARDATLGDPSTPRPTHVITSDPVTCTVSKTGNLSTVSFSKVYAKVITYYANTGTAAIPVYPTPTTATTASFVNLSALYGWTFGITLVAKNSNGSRSDVSADTNASPVVAKEGDVAFTQTRQAFAAKTIFNAIATVGSKTKPEDLVTNPGQASETTTVYKDARTTQIDAFGVDNSGNGGNHNSAVQTDVIFLSASIKDLTAANFDTVGRKVDKIRYEIFQTLADGSKHSVKAKEDVAPSHWITTSTDASGVVSEATVAYPAARNINQGLNLAYTRPIPTWDSSTSASATYTNLAGELTPNRFNTWVKKSDTKKGYKLRMEISLVSEAANDLAESPAKTTLSASAKEYVTAHSDIVYDTIPVEDHDEVSHVTATAGDGQMTIYWSAPNMAAPELQGAESTPTLTGYQIDLYDVVTRTAGNDSAGTARHFIDEGAGAGSSAASLVDALSTPVQTISAATLAVTGSSHPTSCLIQGLTNGKHYVPIIRTVTLQGTASVISAGRTVGIQVGSKDDEWVKHDVKVFYASTTGVVTTNLAYTAARWKKVIDDADKTEEVLKTSTAAATTVIPYGTPFIVANLTATPNTLKIDDNGSGLLYGAMLQTAVGGDNGPASTTAQRLGTLSEANQSNANANVFYLDLSFGQPANIAAAGDPATTAFDADSVSTYVSVAAADAGTPYPGRNVTNVNSKYLGDNWSAETNFIFASNKAGTTVGKISSSTYAAVTQ